MVLTINGKTANTRPNSPLVINNHQRLVTPEVNGLVPFHININGLDRPPVLPSCVLDAPLWHPALGGATFKSLDTNALTGTVTGALWTPQGRSFDGVDDKISIPDNDAWDFGTGAFSILMWLKNPTNDDGYPIVHGGRGYTVADVVGWSILFNTTFFRWSYYTTPGATLVEALDFAYTFGSGFAQFALVRDAASDMRAYINGVQIGATQASVANVSLSALALRIGVAYSDAEGGYLAMTCGDVLIYKGKGLTQGELAQDYTTTKWRFV